MSKRFLGVLLVIFLGWSASCWGAAAFDAAVLNDTLWYVHAAGSCKWVDADGKGKDSIDDLVFLTFHADHTFNVDEIEDDSGTELFAGTWDCDAKGKVTLAVDPESLKEWFARDVVDLDDGDILHESTLAASGVFSGKVTRKGDVVSLKIKGGCQITGTYEIAEWIYDSDTDEWNEDLVVVHGLEQYTFTMSGSYDVGGAALENRTYQFADLPIRDKIGKQTVKNFVSCDLVLKPDNTYFGQFTLSFGDGSHGGLLEGYYTTSGKKLLLYLGELVAEEMIKEPSMDYLNGLLEEYTLTMDDYDEDWEVDYDNGGLTLTENSKKQTAKIGCKLEYEARCWYEGEVEEGGVTSFTGTGGLVE